MLRYVNWGPVPVAVLGIYDSARLGDLRHQLGLPPPHILSSTCQPPTLPLVLPPLVLTLLLRNRLHLGPSLLADIAL